MALHVERMPRVFEFGGVKLPDPNPALSIEQVRDMYVNTYPDLATAAVEGPETVAGEMHYRFQRAVGAKG